MLSDSRFSGFFLVNFFIFRKSENKDPVHLDSQSSAILSLDVLYTFL